MNIQPISELKNYNTILQEVKVGEPMYLTKNGKGQFVIFSIEDAEDYQEYKLYKQSINNSELRSQDFFIKDVEDLTQKLIKSCEEAERNPKRYTLEDIQAKYEEKYGRK